RLSIQHRMHEVERLLLRWGRHAWRVLHLRAKCGATLPDQRRAYEQFLKASEAILRTPYALARLEADIHCEALKNSEMHNSEDDLDITLARLQAAVERVLELPPFKRTTNYDPLHDYIVHLAAAVWLWTQGEEPPAVSRPNRDGAAKLPPFG